MAICSYCDIHSYSGGYSYRKMLDDLLQTLEREGLVRDDIIVRFRLVYLLDNLYRELVKDLEDTLYKVRIEERREEREEVTINVMREVRFVLKKHKILMTKALEDALDGVKDSR